MRGSHATHAVAQAMERALRPGTFIPDQACFAFVTQLDKVATRIEALVAEGEPGCAVTLYELFLAACLEKAEELDDSSGQFGQFVEGLYGGWITAREAVGADPAETAATLLAWMKKDPYGFCSHLERRAVEVFTPRGLAAFEQAVRHRVQAATTAPSPKSVKKPGRSAMPDLADDRQIAVV